MNEQLNSFKKLKCNVCGNNFFNPSIKKTQTKNPSYNTLNICKKCFDLILNRHSNKKFDKTK